jgi:hypothetical protein
MIIEHNQAKEAMRGLPILVFVLFANFCSTNVQMLVFPGTHSCSLCALRSFVSALKTIRVISSIRGRLVAAAVWLATSSGLRG